LAKDKGFSFLLKDALHQDVNRLEKDLIFNTSSFSLNSNVLGSIDNVLEAINNSKIAHKLADCIKNRLKAALGICISKTREALQRSSLKRFDRDRLNARINSEVVALMNKEALPRKTNPSEQENNRRRVRKLEAFGRLFLKAPLFWLVPNLKQQVPLNLELDSISISAIFSQNYSSFICWLQEKRKEKRDFDPIE